MTISWLDFLAVVFAAGAIIEVWHKGSLFATARAYAQALHDVTPNGTAKGLLLELVNCPFCKSYHVPLYLFLMLLVGDWFGGILQILCRVVVYSLAATRLSNIVDTLLPKNSQYIPQ